MNWSFSQALSRFFSASSLFSVFVFIAVLTAMVIAGGGKQFYRQPALKDTGDHGIYYYRFTDANDANVTIDSEFFGKILAVTVDPDGNDTHRQLIIGCDPPEAGQTNVVKLYTWQTIDINSVNDYNNYEYSSFSMCGKLILGLRDTNETDTNHFSTLDVYMVVKKR